MAGLSLDRLSMHAMVLEPLSGLLQILQVSGTPLMCS
jgi:hypothetical protein